MANVQADAEPRRSALPIMAAAAAIALLAAGAALWMRFGESVYATSIVNAILSCF
jgi:hypothetical protein